MRAFSRAMFRSVFGSYTSGTTMLTLVAVKAASVWEMFWRPLATRSGSGGTELSWSKPPTTSTMSFGRGDRRRIPAGVLLVRGFQGLRALLFPGIAVVIEGSVRVAGEELQSKRVSGPIRSRAGLQAPHPSFRLRVEDVDLVQPIVALHVVAAKDIDPSVRQRHARIAVRVVEHTFRISVFRERRPVHGEIGFVQQGRVELATVLERVRVGDVE